MSKLYANFEDLVQSHDALFKPHRTSGALNVCRGVWEAREPEVESLRNQLIALKEEYDQLAKNQELTTRELNQLRQSKEQEAAAQKLVIRQQQKELDAKTSTLNEVQIRADQLARDLERLQKYEDSLDAVQRSQYSEIESLKRRLAAQSTLRNELEMALTQMRQICEREQLEIMSKDDLIGRLQARIEDLEGRMKQQQRLNARMGVELDRFARENDQLARAINLA